MTVSTSTPLRSITTRTLAHISATATSSADTSSSPFSSMRALMSTSAGEDLIRAIETASASPSSALTFTSASTTMNNPSSVESSSLSQVMRTFAVIICNECLYLEFPGCDVHGILYTERAPVSEEDNNNTSGIPKLHAKCPKCAAATNNVRPFREGCRRCKANTTVYMWCSTLREMTQAHDAFLTHAEEMEHTALMCSCCHSVIFPRAREMLTKRTSDHELMTISGKPLFVSNFQLSMPHLQGCPRKGMPIQTVPIQLTKSELRFVLERIEQCPVSTSIQVGPQYRARQQIVMTEQNHLHQIYVRMLQTIIKSYDPNTIKVIDPLRQMLHLFDHMKPLSLFPDWSPSRILPKTLLKPIRVEASSVLDEQYSGENVLVTSTEYWQPGKETSGAHWLDFHFQPSVALSCMELQWHPDYTVPPRYVISVTLEDGTIETLSIVVQGRSHQLISFTKQSSVVSLRLFIQCPNGGSCGLESVQFHEVAINQLHTPTETLLHDLQQWLLSASFVASFEEVRDIGIITLQKLTLASGSLCGLLQLTTGLLLNVSPSTTHTMSDDTKHFDEQDWNRLDQLSDRVRDASIQFLTLLAQQMLKMMVNDSEWLTNGEYSLDTQTLERMQAAMTLSDNVNEPKDQDKTESKDSPISSTVGLYPAITMNVVTNRHLMTCIRRRSHVGMLLILMLSEFSTWEMKRMQKAEEFAGKKEEDLLQLEKAFAIEVRPQFFMLSQQLLGHVMSSKLSGSRGSTNPNSCAVLGFDLYEMLGHSMKELCSAITSIPSQLDLTQFTPDSLCMGILQVVTSNIRRLVLSRVDPGEIGIIPAIIRDDDDLLSAPPALEPMVVILEHLASLSAKRTDTFFPISLKAAAAVEVGMEAFYPSAHQRTKLLTSRMGQGSTLELQVRWPVQERDQEDPRYERLILMLQFECIRRGLVHAIRGRWHFFMHLTVQVPEHEHTEHVLQRHFAPCIQQAGFSSWQVVAGAQEISINLQRHLHWNRIEKMSQDSGAGWIRVYPRDVALYEDVLAEVDLFLSDHDKQIVTESKISHQP